MRTKRAEISGAQPYQYPNPNGCGGHANQTPPWTCYTYAGNAHLDFKRPHVGLTLTRNDSGVVQSFVTVSFTAGKSVAAIGSLAVPISEIRWTWLPEGPPDDFTM